MKKMGFLFLACGIILIANMTYAASISIEFSSPYQYHILEGKQEQDFIVLQNGHSSPYWSGYPYFDPEEGVINSVTLYYSYKHAVSSSYENATMVFTSASHSLLDVSDLAYYSQEVQLPMTDGQFFTHSSDITAAYLMNDGFVVGFNSLHGEDQWIIFDASDTHMIIDYSIIPIPLRHPPPRFRSNWTRRDQKETQVSVTTYSKSSTMRQRVSITPASFFSPNTPQNRARLRQDQLSSDEMTDAIPLLKTTFPRDRSLISASPVALNLDDMGDESAKNF